MTTQITLLSYTVVFSLVFTVLNLVYLIRGGRLLERGRLFEEIVESLVFRPAHNPKLRQLALHRSPILHGRGWAFINARSFRTSKLKVDVNVEESR